MTHSNPKAILFDMDDTILNYDSVADPSWRQVCESVAPEIIGLESEELFTALKTKSQWFWGDPERHLVPTFHPAAALRGGADVLARMRADLVRAKVLMGDR